MKFKISKLLNDHDLDVDVIEIENSNNYKIKFYTLGGYMHEIHIPKLDDPSQTEDVVLGYDDFEDVIESKDYFNSIIGRVCNRIGNSKFTLNNKEYNLFSNTPPDHLHGGREGFNKKIWKIEDIQNEKDFVRCTLSYLSKNMEENYPGNLECKVIYELNNSNEILLTIQATSDSDTIVNITNHNYWNFHGHNNYYQNIGDHLVRVNSNIVCEIDNSLVPTGKLLNVKGTKFDLNEYLLIDKNFLDDGGIDNHYSLQDILTEDPIACVFSNLTGMGAEYSTNQPGIQFYTGNNMQNKYKGKYNKNYGLHHGLCLETQNFPDAINQENFPSPILRKGENYKSFTKIKLRNNFL